MFSCADHLLRYLDRSGEIGAIGFYTVPPIASHYSAVRDLPFAAGASPRVVPLLQPHIRGPFRWAFNRGEYNEAVLRGYLVPKGPFQGIGEIGMYIPDNQDITFESPPMQTVFRTVNEMKGIVIIHPPEGPITGRTLELAEIEPVIRQYSGINFLFHGGFPGFDRVILPLMSRYPNVYFSMDVGVWLFGIDGTTLWGSKPVHLSDPGAADVGSTERFLAAVERVGRDRLLEEGVRKSLVRLRQHPDRIMWGTDRAEPWNFEERATELIIEPSRQFIARLPQDLQEKYAFRNALRIFRPYLSPSP